MKLNFYSNNNIKILVKIKSDNYFYNKINDYILNKNGNNYISLY